MKVNQLQYGFQFQLNSQIDIKILNKHMYISKKFKNNEGDIECEQFVY